MDRADSKGRHRVPGQKIAWPEWIERQLIRRGITDHRVLEAFRQVPRGDFLPPGQEHLAEWDSPVPIGCGQTISQPYIVAVALQALALTGEERVLDVGTGSGYQAALLSHLAAEVFSIEIHSRLLIHARQPLERHGACPVYTRLADGSLGWPEEAPFDAIVVGARAPKPPPTLIAQLAIGGRLVVPVGGEFSQMLVRITRRPGGELDKTMLEHVRFVPLLGKEGASPLPSFS
ncbi:MAG: protein-L-isoaspartate(D-aspartate) O-methyltransferase [Deltaproteobacteria bacterium]|nr:protein-L-isoaspartate(D-aspartate) O-methyltransferase [Deltaproteobacteria bacterium]